MAELLNVILATLVALYFMMLGMWRRYPAAGVIALAFVAWIVAFLFLVWTGAAEGIMK
jgi:hypothetical protein